MQLKPEETELRGYWIDLGSSMTPDAAWERITILTREYLKLVATRSDESAVLYRDPADARFWELTSIAPQMKDGGPPLLACIGPERARERYGAAAGL
jgi:Immunity protein 27